MKKRVRRNRETRRRELVVTPGKGEALNPRQSVWLRERPHRTFLRFDFTHGSSARDVVLTYDIEGLVSLRTHLKRARLDEAQLASLLADVALSQIWCTKGGWRYFSMLFDPADVFVDCDGHLAFAFVPLDGMEFRVENSPLMLLRALSDTRRVSPEGQNAQVLVRRLSDFVLAENEVFSLNSFRAFIRSECWIDIDLDGNVRQIGGSGVGAGTDAGGHDDIPTVVGDELVAPDQELGPAGSPPARFVLVRLADGERLPVPGGETILVGRGSACQARVLGNPRVGRQHLALRCTGEGLVLRDLGSRNGTFALGKRLEADSVALVPYGAHFWMADEECVVDHA